MAQITVFLGRTNKVPVSLPWDVSADQITSEIRVDKDSGSELIATWDVGFVTNGADGELELTLDDSVTSAITHFKGYMDLKRVSNGEPLSVWDDPVEVLFRKTVTL